MSHNAQNAKPSVNTQPIQICQSDFGDWIDISKALPVNADLAILCKNSGTGHKVVKLMLRHQCYVEDLKAIREKEPGATFCVFPIISGQAIDLTPLLDEKEESARG